MVTPANTIKSQYPHIEWIDLNRDGVMVECAVMKRDDIGNVYFFEVGKLDMVDKRRLHSIVTDRNANNFELWDLMSNKALGNGVNALEYFHQLVKILTPGGTIINAKMGRVGAPGRVATQAPSEQVAQAAAAAAAAEASAPEKARPTAKR